MPPKTDDAPAPTTKPIIRRYGDGYGRIERGEYLLMDGVLHHLRGDGHRTQAYRCSPIEVMRVCGAKDRKNAMSDPTIDQLRQQIADQRTILHGRATADEKVAAWSEIIRLQNEMARLCGVEIPVVKRRWKDTKPVEFQY